MDRSSVERLILGATRHWDVWFEGWSTRLDVLVNSGWRVSLKTFDFANEAVIAFKHSTGLLLVTMPFNLAPLARFHSAPIRGEFRVQRVIWDRDRVATHVVHSALQALRHSDQSRSMDCDSFTEVDAAAYYGFKPEVTTPAGIIVSRENVGQVLDMIRKVQEPVQAEIRARAPQKARVEAQIITLAA